jgi:hypothetical protein
MHPNYVFTTMRAFQKLVWSNQVKISETDESCFKSRVELRWTVIWNSYTCDRAHKCRSRIYKLEILCDTFVTTESLPSSTIWDYSTLNQS